MLDYSLIFDGVNESREVPIDDGHASKSDSDGHASKSDSDGHAVSAVIDEW